VTKTSPLLRLLETLRHHRRRVWLAVFCSVVNKIWDLAPPVLIGAAVDVVVEREDSFIAGLGYPDVKDQLAFLAVATVIIWGMESLFEYAYGWLWRTLAQTTQHELRVRAYAHIQDLEMAWFGDQSRGELMSILNDDINQLERFLDEGANDLLQVMTTVVTVGGAFFLISPEVAIWAVLPIPVVVWGSFRFQSRIAPRYSDVRQKVGELNAILNNNLTGIETIKSFTTETREVDRVERASAAYRTSNRHAIRLSAAFSPLIRMAIVVGFTATLLVGGWQTLDGYLAVGAYSVLIFMTQRLLWPLTRLGRTFDLYQRAMASTQRVLDLLDTPVQVVDGPEALDSGVKGRIAFEGIHFAYANREPVLQDFSLQIDAGQTVALVGPTGSGKTTVIRLLLRFHDFERGSITLDGLALDQLQLAALRRQIAMVSQHPVLFPGTVRDNIAYARPEASQDEIEIAAKTAEAHAFITALPEGYQTRVGEDGHKLSGGQRQRVAIARAVLKDAAVLVFDEATSAVDNETEAALQRSLERISADRTTLVIAHRLSTIRNADLIAVLDQGQIVEQGSHESLIAQNGLYARLWAVQTGASFRPPNEPRPEAPIRVD
jgi:ATP-binding cassette subfamily B protein